MLPHAREAVRAFKHVAQRGVWFNMLQVLSLLALLVPKYNTDAEAFFQAAEAAYAEGDLAGAYWRYAIGTQFTCFRHAVFLLYQFQSMNTDAGAMP